MPGQLTLEVVLARCCCAHPGAVKACQALTVLLFVRTLMCFVISVTRLNLEPHSTSSRFGVHHCMHGAHAVCQKRTAATVTRANLVGSV
jgi:hypothetical protein